MPPLMGFFIGVCSVGLLISLHLLYELVKVLKDVVAVLKENLNDL